MPPTAPLLPSACDPPAAPPFRSFWMGGFEGADHVNGQGQALDMAGANGHRSRLAEDYAAAAALGLASVRESVGWRLCEPDAGRHDFSPALQMAHAARQQGLQVVWTLMHYGLPDDLSLFDDRLIDRFARFAAAAAQALAPFSEGPPIYNPINEIGFLAWAASETRLLAGTGPQPQPVGSEGTLQSGYALKCRLVRAALRAMQAILAVDPRARFLHVEPLVHVVAPAGQPEWDALADQVAAYQWQVWDLIAEHPPPLRRQLQPAYAAALARWQRRLTAGPCSPALEKAPMLPTLLVFSHLRWGFVYQRPQQIMSRLARHYRVVFVEEPMQDVGAAWLVRSQPAPGVEVLCLHTPVAAPGFHDDHLPLLRPLLGDFLRAEGISAPVAWLYTPMALPLLSGLGASQVVYDCMDELAAFQHAPRQLRQRETALMKTADIVLTGGPSLFEARKGRHPRLHCMPSAVDEAHFSPARLRPGSVEARTAQALHADIGSPRLGFFGVIDERMDLGLVDHLARARPDWQVVMAGPVVKIAPQSLPQRPNLHWLGMQAYAVLPYLVACWDVCLLPFALNESTRFISPTKTLEYMAADKPVVSTPVRDVKGLYGDCVCIAADAAAFVAGCEAALAETPSQQALRSSRMATTVWCMSWDATVAAILKLLQTDAGAPVQRALPEEPAPQFGT